MIKLYDSLSRQKKALPDQKKIRLFVCGPTVYDYAHIGHARTYIFFDFFAKYLRAQGYEVTYLQNITDIDDKIIKRAAEENKKPEELARFFTDAYKEDMKALGVDAVAEYAPATKFISQIVAQVRRLIDKEIGYKIEGDGWYFDISKFSDYGKLSGRTALQAEDAVSRIDEAVGKRNKGDFCLWKFSKPGEPVWPAPIGNGRPGWHIEDTAITEFYFGPQYDIHGGGIDLKFPHHEAEIAQQEAVSGKKPLAEIWMHAGTLLAEGKKMSKSLGNFTTIRDFLKKYSPEVLRWIVFLHPYRSPIDYSDQSAKDAEINLDAINQFLKKLETVIQTKNEAPEPLGIQEEIEKRNKWIDKYLHDDINTVFLLTEPLGLRTEYQEQLHNMRSSEAKLLKERIEAILKMIGITLKSPEIPSKISKLALEREQFRSSKQFEQSDRLRKEINGLGYEIEDTPRGPFLWPLQKNHN